MAAAPREASAAKGKDAEPAPAPKKKGKRVPIAIGLVVLLAGGGAGAYYFLKPHPPAAEGAAEEGKTAAAPTKAPVFLPLDTFTVNLRDQGAERYLQAGITLELGNDESSERLKAHLPIARSRILLLLSSKEAHDLDKVEDKNRLATEIVAELGKLPALKDAKVTAVHFSAFVIQ